MQPGEAELSRASMAFGLYKKNYFPLTMEAGQIELMKKIKQAADPLGILNPGKIF